MQSGDTMCRGIFFTLASAQRTAQGACDDGSWGASLHDSAECVRTHRCIGVRMRTFLRSLTSLRVRERKAQEACVRLHADGVDTFVRRDESRETLLRQILQILSYLYPIDSMDSIDSLDSPWIPWTPWSLWGVYGVYGVYSMESMGSLGTLCWYRRLSSFTMNHFLPHLVLLEVTIVGRPLEKDALAQKTYCTSSQQATSSISEQISDNSVAACAAGLMLPTSNRQVNLSLAERKEGIFLEKASPPSDTPPDIDSILGGRREQREQCFPQCYRAFAAVQQRIAASSLCVRACGDGE